MSEPVKTHEERIVCPACGVQQAATVEHTWPWWSYVHRCERCAYTITESEWTCAPVLPTPGVNPFRAPDSHPPLAEATTDGDLAREPSLAVSAELDREKCAAACELEDEVLATVHELVRANRVGWLTIGATIGAVIGWFAHWIISL